VMDNESPCQGLALPKPDNTIFQTPATITRSGG
jgi:hypothetical protein